MTSSTRPTYNRRASDGKETDMSEQEPREGQPTDEEIQDLDVSEEQTDDVTGGARREGRPVDDRFDPGAAK
jgi:hypothetical protein